MDVELNEYEVANLREGLKVLRRIGFDTGDWLGQILYKLDQLEPDITHAPNKTSEEQIHTYHLQQDRAATLEILVAEINDWLEEPSKWSVKEVTELMESIHASGRI